MENSGIEAMRCGATEQANERLGKSIFAMPAVQGDARNYLLRNSFPDAWFDVIFALGVLMRTGYAKAAARSLTARLKPGAFNHLGLVIIQSNNGNPRSRSTLRKWLRPFLGSPEDVVLRGGTCK